MFGGIAVAPLLLVFTFSVIFLTRGIDSWFHAEVRQGLSDALNLSRAAARPCACASTSSARSASPTG
jgi:nitrogen fixation/metabolism regulation signal transduction histidine kinase